MTAVGVQGLGAGHGQDHPAEHEVAGGAVVGHEPDRPGRGQTLDDRGVLEHLAEAEMPIAVNQTRITGPNTEPIVPDPNRCSTNSPSRIATDRGTTRCANAGVATCTPWIEPRTEIAA